MIWLHHLSAQHHDLYHNADPNNIAKAQELRKIIRILSILT